jgi:hypothetical protein
MGYQESGEVTYAWQYDSILQESLVNTFTDLKIRLGQKGASGGPILKGDALVTELQNLINQLIQLTTTLVAVPQASTAASLVLSELPKISWIAYCI